MLRYKEGFPQEGELVYCTVKEIQHSAVFVIIDEYKKDALLPIPEVSPGRIRNLRDFVKPGKKIVCLVLSVNPKTNHIVVSLRRVNETQRRKVIERMRQEQTAEGVLQYVATRLGIKVEELYKKIWEKIKKDYNYLYDFFIDVVNNEVKLENFVEKKIAKILLEEISSRIKPRKYEQIVKIEIKIFRGDGVLILRNVFQKLEKRIKKIKNLEYYAKYLGGGKYEISCIAQEPERVNEAVGYVKEEFSKFEDEDDIEIKMEVEKKKI